MYHIELSRPPRSYTPDSELPDITRDPRIFAVRGIRDPDGSYIYRSTGSRYDVTADDLRYVVRTPVDPGRSGFGTSDHTVTMAPILTLSILERLGCEVRLDAGVWWPLVAPDGPLS